MKKFNLYLSLVLSLVFLFLPTAHAEVSAAEAVETFKQRSASAMEYVDEKYATAKKAYQESDLGMCKKRFSFDNRNASAMPTLSQATQALFKEHKADLIEAYNYFLEVGYSKEKLASMKGLPSDFGAAAVKHMMIRFGNKTLRCGKNGFYQHLLYMESYAKTEDPAFYKALQAAFPSGSS